MVIMVKKMTSLLITLTMVYSASCVSLNNCEKCNIEKVLDFAVINKYSYSMQVRFNHCKLRKDREDLVKKEMIKKYPNVKKEAIYIDEYLGKMYNEYRYKISYWCPIKNIFDSSEKGTNYSASPQRFVILRLPQPKFQIYEQRYKFLRTAGVKSVDKIDGQA